MDHRFHEMISIPDLLLRAGITKTEGQGWTAVAHGRVRIEEWTIGIAEGTLPRWVLRGVRITVGDRSIKISDDGLRIVRADRRVSLSA